MLLPGKFLGRKMIPLSFMKISDNILPNSRFSKRAQTYKLLASEEELSFIKYLFPTSQAFWSMLSYISALSSIGKETTPKPSLMEELGLLA